MFVYLNLNIMFMRLFKSFLNLFVLEFKINILKKNQDPMDTVGSLDDGDRKKNSPHRESRKETRDN